MPKKGKYSITGNAARKRNAIKRQQRIAAESTEERNRRLAAMAQYRRERILAETEHERSIRLAYAAQRSREKLQAETEHERSIRLAYAAQRSRERRQAETEHERSIRLAGVAQRARERRQAEKRNITMPKKKTGVTGNGAQKRNRKQLRRLLEKKGLPPDFWKQYGTHEFNSEWMKYCEWVAPVKNNKYKVRCTWCNLNVDLRNTGNLALFAHEKSKKHRNIWNQNAIDDDHSSLKAVSPSIPQASPVVRITNKSPNLLVTSRVSSIYQTNLSNCNFIIYKVRPVKGLVNVRNTREFGDGSRLDLSESNGFSENNSKLTQSVTGKNSSLVLLGSITAQAADSPSNEEQSVFLAHNDDNVAVTSVSIQPSQTGTTVERSSSYPSIPSSSVKQEFQNAEMTFEIGSTSFTAPAAIEETNRYVEMILKKDIDDPSTSAVSTATLPTEQNTEKGIDYPSTSGFSTASPEPSHIATTMKKSRSYPSIPSSSVAVYQELQNAEIKFGIDSSFPVPNPPTAMEPTPQNAEVIFEIHSNSCTTPASMKEPLRNVEMALKKGIDYPSTSAVSTVMVPTERNTEKGIDNSSISSFCTASPEPSQIGVTMDKTNSYPSIPSSSLAVEQELQNSSPELLDSITSRAADYPSNGGQPVFLAHNNDNVTVASVSPKPSQTGMTMERSSSCPYIPNSSVVVKQEPLNVEMTFEIDSSYPSVPSSSTAMEKTSKGIEYPSTSAVSTARDKLCLKNEVCSILERLDEAKRVNKSKCPIIMEDYKMLLNKFSQVSDPTFQPSEFLMPEYASSWNSLKLMKILLSEENILGHGFSHNNCDVRRGRSRKHKV